ncbi:MAG: hypothetical protein K8I82_24295 [Anaerolineae bacterium]|nr:hypothetical protein [Anaerolineae bacterium]
MKIFLDEQDTDFARQVSADLEKAGFLIEDSFADADGIVLLQGERPIPQIHRPVYVIKNAADYDPQQMIDVLNAPLRLADELKNLEAKIQQFEAVPLVYEEIPTNKETPIPEAAPQIQIQEVVEDAAPLWWESAFIWLPLLIPATALVLETVPELSYDLLPSLVLVFSLLWLWYLIARRGFYPSETYSGSLTYSLIILVSGMGIVGTAYPLTQQSAPLPVAMILGLAYGGGWGAAQKYGGHTMIYRVAALVIFLAGILSGGLLLWESDGEISRIAVALGFTLGSLFYMTLASALFASMTSWARFLVLSLVYGFLMWLYWLGGWQQVF